MPKEQTEFSKMFAPAAGINDEIDDNERSSLHVSQTAVGGGLNPDYKAPGWLEFDAMNKRVIELTQNQGALIKGISRILAMLDAHGLVIQSLITEEGERLSQRADLASLAFVAFEVDLDSMAADMARQAYENGVPELEESDEVDYGEGAKVPVMPLRAETPSPRAYSNLAGMMALLLGHYRVLRDHVNLQVGSEFVAPALDAALSKGVEMGVHSALMTARSYGASFRLPEDEAEPVESIENEGGPNLA